MYGLVPASGGKYARAAGGSQSTRSLIHTRTRPVLDFSRRNLLAVAVTSLSTVALRSLPVSAQTPYPEHPIRLLVPRSAGGVVDIIARLWAERIKPHLGPIVIENQGGGGGTIAATAVAHAPADGYTLLAGTTSELVINPVIMSQASYDPVKDLAPIVMTAVSVSSLMVHASVPVRTLLELVAYAKANPGKLSYGSAGTGTPAHLCGELFKMLAGLPDIVHVPYKGAAPGLADFFAGHLPMMAASISPAVLEMHRAGKIRILAAGTNRHLLAAPDVPISTEAGFPELITLQFNGVFAPAGTPPSIIAHIAAATRPVMADPEVQQKLIQAGFEPVIDSGPKEAAQFVHEELVRWTPLLKASGLHIN
jgi:tripartite-type tricarboxylate transporter receptor subunit TctC